jgi:hypothetical protein
MGKFIYDSFQFGNSKVCPHNLLNFSHLSLLDLVIADLMQIHIRLLPTERRDVLIIHCLIK